MKKILLSLLLLSFFYRANASQWYVGVSVNDSILSGGMNGSNNCFPVSENSLMYPVCNVTGMKYALIVRYVSVSNSIYTTQNGILNVGDSLFFTPSTPIYDFFYPVNGSSFSYVIRAVGTPQVSGQTYPCGSYFEVCTLSTCQYTCQYFFSSQCTVQLASAVKEENNSASFSLYPNPTSFSFTINSSEKISSIEIFDILGDLIQKENCGNQELATINLLAPKGVYFVRVINEDGNFEMKRIVLE